VLAVLAALTIGPTVKVTLTGEVHMDVKLEATGEVGGSRGVPWRVLRS
jgi:hypothetical protein